MKTRFIIIILLTAFFKTAVAQESADVDSLFKKLNEANTDTARAFIYSRLCFSYCTINIDSALFYGNKSMELAVKAEDEKSVAAANNVLGWAYSCKGDN